MPAHRIRVEAGNHERVHAPFSWRCPPDLRQASNLQLRDDDSQTLPVQTIAAGSTATLCAVVPLLLQNEVRTYALQQGPTGETAQGVEVREASHGVDVSIDGKPLTSYVTKGEGLARPYCYPLYGPQGVMLTRRFPMERDVPGETSDHPHHRSFFVAYGDINSVDNWSEGVGHGYTRHTGFDAMVSGPVCGSFRALAEWTDAAGTPLLLERRDVTFYRQPDTERAIDLEIAWTAGDEPVTFGDTKEGGIIALRVASSMAGARGGVLENSFGGIGEAETWGKRAEWCDYAGDVDGKLVGIAIFDHLDNFRAPSYWHIRNYGLFATNVFGGEAFTGDPKRNGSYTLAAGDSLVFRYRVFLHAGNATDAKIKDRFHDFVNPPSVTVL